MRARRRRRREGDGHWTGNGVMKRGWEMMGVMEGI